MLHVTALRQSLLKVVDEGGKSMEPETLRNVMRHMEYLAVGHANLPQEDWRNYAVIRNYLVTASALYKQIADYPNCLGESKDILPEEFPFSRPELCNLFADCYEKLGNIAGRCAYESDRLAHLQSVWEVNGKKPEDADRLKDWSEKAHATRERSTKVYNNTLESLQHRRCLSYQLSDCLCVVASYKQRTTTRSSLKYASG